VADSRDLSFVEIELRDAEGNIADGHERTVSVLVEGAGRLQGFGSARPDPTASYLDTVQTTFDGRLLAVIRPTAPGDITVTVESHGLPSVHLTLRASDSPAAAGRP
jgi:hypothetical protein